MLIIVKRCSNWGFASDSLIRVRLRHATGLARDDPLALGLDIDGEGRLVNYDGEIESSIDIIGWLRRGRRIETGVSLRFVNKPSASSPSDCFDCHEDPQAAEPPRRTRPEIPSWPQSGATSKSVETAQCETSTSRSSSSRHRYLASFPVAASAMLVRSRT